MTTLTTTPASSSRHRLDAAPPRVVLLPVVTTLCAIGVVLGFLARDEMYVTPDAGLGYGLGVAGLCALCSLLLYSLRKRARSLRSWGALRHWFHVHMMLGVVGPTLVLFHANFEVHSTNAAVALGAMVIVAASGFVGRFAYSRVHLGLFGQRETLRDVSARADASRSALHTALRAVPEVELCVREFEQRALARSGGVLAELWRAVELGRQTRSIRRRARAMLRQASPAALPAGASAVSRGLDTHLALVRRVAEFGFYEGVLSLWHALHVPLGVVLYIAAAIHVIAVHLY